MDAKLGVTKWGGLTDHGRKVIAEMNRLGILVALSHASETAKMQVIEVSRAPVVGIHHGLKHFVDYPRSLSNEVVKAMAAKGGLAGMHTSPNMLSREYRAWSETQAAGSSAPSLRHLIQDYTFFRKPYENFGAYINQLDAEMHDRWEREPDIRGGTRYGVPWRERHQRAVDAGAPLPTGALVRDIALEPAAGDCRAGPLDIEYTAGRARQTDWHIRPPPAHPKGVCWTKLGFIGNGHVDPTPFSGLLRCYGRIGSGSQQGPRAKPRRGLL